ncbi:MAG: hypothetical protein AB8C84_13230 [Oligoflexales bacterium]
MLINRILFFLLLIQVQVKSYATEVYIIEVEMTKYGGNLMQQVFTHQGLRFKQNLIATECHFTPSGLKICDAGKYDNGYRIYTAVKHVGEVDKSIQDCREWCKQWSRRNKYGVGSLCWTLVGEFIRAHGLKKHAAIRDPKLQEDCLVQ